jgi:hypothetical protein
VRADSLYGLEVLVSLVFGRFRVNVACTWTAAAPVSSVLFMSDSGSPAVLLVTGRESMPGIRDS